MLDDLTTYNVKLTAIFEGQQASTIFVINIQKECGATMLPKALAVNLNGFIGLPTIFDLPPVTDRGDLLLANNAYCGSSTYSASGNITTIA